ncbi:hypothetical protein [Mycolicibacterium brisbanense]|uniref:Uncharacterized protein n=1 Tax=Mycolicibacterium brisbanense TaxID=146020 RepID=A0A100W2N1_9MYCO|nr:hypothetical protein [Mycolicibacterium brisbanense]MCV7158461.1 hypothetical protein [Mycolicibacterium brisbanense]GAS90487.1 uncharacterized protein RMCB_4583 [Mycolicibacterium brisbanense]
MAGNTTRPIIDESNGTVACCVRLDSTYVHQTPVLAWDAQGFALVADVEGCHLVRAADWAAEQHGTGSPWLVTADEAALYAAEAQSGGAR